MEIEARRDGSASWQALPVTNTQAVYSAMVDDPELSSGRYELRAHATDVAGNDRFVSARADGAPMSILLPVRAASTLAVGQLQRVRVKQPRGKRSIVRELLVKRPQVGFGRSLTLHGTLSDASGRPHGRATVTVYARTGEADAPWNAAGSVSTGSNGTFAYRVSPGPTRSLRFVYDGAATVRPASDEVEFRVRAGITLGSNRRSIRNGNTVEFSGRVLGQPVPAAGKLVLLQAFTKRGWETFATPHADGNAPQSRTIVWQGDWKYRYPSRDTRPQPRHAV